MIFQRVLVESFRNLHPTEWIPHAQFNYIWGENGSGKTSLLEALYYLGHLRSFRTHLNNRIIQTGQEQLVLYADLAYPNQSLSLAIRRHIDKTLICLLQQRPVESLAEIAKLLPIVLLNPDSFEILSGGPKIRRALLDWGVFHLDAHFFTLWSYFQRGLRQRNEALRQGLSWGEINSWDGEYVRVGEAIHHLRLGYFAQLEPYLRALIQSVPVFHDLTMEYQAGWPIDRDLATLLTTHYDKDRARGFTYYGPQRADIVFKIKGLPAEDFLSRGEQKLLVSLFKLAQMKLFSDYTGQPSIVLIDDLAAELGEGFQYHLREILGALRAQVFITSIRPQSFEPFLALGTYSMFHVEHGLLKG